jgi:hypothetical protein
MSETKQDPTESTIDDLDAEVVEDLDVDDDAEGVEGGTSMHTAACPTF